MLAYHGEGEAGLLVQSTLFSIVRKAFTVSFFHSPGKKPGE